MFRKMFPRDVTGQVNGILNFRLIAIADGQVVLFTVVVDVGDRSAFSHNFDSTSTRPLNLLHMASVQQRLPQMRLFEPQLDAFDLQPVDVIERRDEFRGVSLDRLPHQRKETGQRIFGRKPAGCSPVSEEFKKRRHDFRSGEVFE